MPYFYDGVKMEPYYNPVFVENVEYDVHFPSTNTKIAVVYKYPGKVFGEKPDFCFRIFQENHIVIDITDKVNEIGSLDMSMVKHPMKYEHERWSVRVSVKHLFYVLPVRKYFNSLLLRFNFEKNCCKYQVTGYFVDMLSRERRRFETWKSRVEKKPYERP